MPNNAGNFAAAAVLSGLLAGCASAPPPPTAPAVIEPEPVAQPPEPPPPTAEELARQRRAQLACNRLTVAAVGDLMLGTDFPQNRLPPDDGRAQLADAAPYLRRADIVFGNVEGVLMDGGEPVKECKDPSACYLFRSPARFARTFADAGFTVMSLANNHARDFGEEGRDASMAALAAAGIRHSGREGDVASWSVGDVRIALIAFAPFKESWPMLDEVIPAAVVTDLAANHDIVIVSFHGGAEGAGAERIPFTTETYYGENRGNVVQFARTLVDAGADLVIGHGPHVPRAMELYGERLVAYSLGNFATWWGINIRGEKGYAPLLSVRLDGNGRLVSGEVVSFRQGRPEGPRLDREQRASRMIRELTAADFPNTPLRFEDAQRFAPSQVTDTDCTGIDAS